MFHTILRWFDATFLKWQYMSTNESSLDFILLIMNCEKYRFKANEQKETWLSNAKFKYYHVLGKNDINDFEFDDEMKILWVNTPDDYNSFPKKVIASYASIRKTFPHCKYIFKTDDDQILQHKDCNKFFENIFNIIEKKTPKVHYGGHIVDVQQPYLSKYHSIHPELPEYLPILSTKYCSGRFYILSMDAVCYLLMKREKIKNEYLEDYAIGLYLNEEKFKKPIFKIDSGKYFKDCAF